jgi:hypothetical protein
MPHCTCNSVQRLVGWFECTVTRTQTESSFLQNARSLRGACEKLKSSIRPPHPFVAKSAIVALQAAPLVVGVLLFVHEAVVVVVHVSMPHDKVVGVKESACFCFIFLTIPVFSAAAASCTMAHFPLPSSLRKPLILAPLSSEFLPSTRSLRGACGECLKASIRPPPEAGTHS